MRSLKVESVESIYICTDIQLESKHYEERLKEDKMDTKTINPSAVLKKSITNTVLSVNTNVLIADIFVHSFPNIK